MLSLKKELGVAPSSDEWRVYLLEHGWDQVMAEISHDERQIVSITLNEFAKGKISDTTLGIFMNTAVTRALSRVISKLESEHG